MPKDSPLYPKAYEVLSNSLLFGNLKSDILEMMLYKCTEVFWKKNENIDPYINEKYLFIIIEGKLKITHINPETGRSIALFLKQAGEIFDIFTLLDDEEHIVFPVPLDNMRVLQIPIKDAREWIKEHPEFNETFLPYLGKKMRDLEEYAASMVFHDTITRLAKLILKHTTNHINKEYPVKLINNLSHESMAELIGSVRSVVSSQLNKLKEEGIIETQRGKIKVKNLEMLLQKCDIKKLTLHDKH